MPSKNLCDFYFKVSTSSSPTDYDKIGCDGMYIKEVVRVKSTNIRMDAIALCKDIISYHNLCFSRVDKCKVRINLTNNCWSKLKSIAQLHHA
jgi:hypothetical protein